MAAGFTSNGLAEGRPQHPGRLNERCHLVFKDAGDSWRKSRRDIAALLKTPYFREGFDGEAVEWACSRLLRRDAGRRILMVISDGSPMDSATNLANDEFYLDNHLKHMVEKYDGGKEPGNLRHRSRPQPDTLLPALYGNRPERISQQSCFHPDFTNDRPRPAALTCIALQVAGGR